LNAEALGPRAHGVFSGRGRSTLPANRAAAAGRSLERLVLPGLVLLLALCPLWFGSNRLVSWGLNAVAIGLLVVLYEAALVLQRKSHPLPPGLIAGPALLLALCTLWIGAQTLPLPVAAHPLWSTASGVLEAEIMGSVSLNGDLTGLALLRLLTGAAVFWLAVQLGRSEGGALSLLKALCVIGAIYAAYGLLGFALAPERLLWFPKTAYLDSVTSSFVNRNSFATYAGLGLLAALGLVASVIEKDMRRGGGWKRALGAALHGLGGSVGLGIAAALVILIALAMSASRAGILCSLLAIAGLAVLLAVHRTRLAVPGVVALAACIFAVGAVMLVYGDAVAGRMDGIGADLARRVAVYGMVADATAQVPLQGAGFGTFADAFPMYRTEGVSSAWTWDKAHNSYLELSYGLGLPAAALLLSAFGLIVARCLHGSLTRRRMAYAPALAVAATILVGLHALVDFSMQIQAVVLTWAALAGLGFAQAFSSRTIAASGFNHEDAAWRPST
jgi:O-antigen ligase